jgi:copper transport protein
MFRCAVLLVAIGAVIATLLGTTGATAHARLSDADPEPGSALAIAPATIRLTFTEPVDAKFSSASLVNVNGQAVPIGNPQPVPDDDHSLSISVSDPASVQPGSYTLIWRSLSAADGHATDGVLSFSVGTGQAPTASSTGQAEESVPWWEISASWLELAGLISVAGFFAFALLVLYPSSTGDSAARDRLAGPLNITWWIGWLIALLGMVAVLVVQVSRVTGDPLFTWPESGTVRTILTDTRFGQCWLVRFVLLVALAVVIALVFGIPRFRTAALSDKKWPWLVGVGISAGMLLTRPISGHAATVDPEWAGVGLDWIHLFSVSVWLGGLLYLVVAMTVLVRSGNVLDARAGAALVKRFSLTALITIAVVIVSGLFNAAFHVSGPRNLTSDNYGLALIIKHLLFIPVLIAAAVNLFVTVPRLKQTTAEGNDLGTKFYLRTLWFTIAAELAIALCVLVAAAALTDLAPADGPLEVDVATKVVSYDQHAPAGDLDVWLLGRIAGDPNDRFTLTLSDQSGKAPTDVTRVIVRATAPTAGGNVSDRFDAEPMAGNAGTYVFPATRIGLAADWTIETTVRRAGIPDQVASFAIDTHGTGVQPPRLVEDHWRLPRMTVIAWLTLGLAIIVSIAGIIGVRKLPELEPFAAALLLTMVVLIVAGFLVTSYRLTIPVSASTDVVNPVAASEDSIRRGQTIYEARCLACHGATGGGTDAQLAAQDPNHQHTTSTDITSKKVSSQRDGDLFDGISSGVPGTDMPAFDTALTEQERWDLVNYLRKLQNAK